MLWWITIIYLIVTHSTVLIPNSHVQDLTSCLAYDNTNTRFGIVTMFMGALLQLPSTMTVIAGTPWWYQFCEKAIVFSFSPADFIDSWR